MELETFQYTEENGWSIKQFPKLDSENTLILIFADPEFIHKTAPIQDIVKHYPKSQIIGCSSPEEITGSFVVGNSVSLVSIADHTMLVSVIRFKYSKLKSVTSVIDENNPFPSVGKMILSQLSENYIRGIIILSDCPAKLFRYFLSELRSCRTSSAMNITCALASNGQNFEPSWVLVNGKIKCNTVIALGIYGEAFHMENAVYYKSQLSATIQQTPILAITQLNYHAFASANDEHQLEDLLTLLPSHTQLIGFYSANDSAYPNDLAQYTCPRTIYFYEDKYPPLKQNKLENLLDGKRIAEKIKEKLTKEITLLQQKKNLSPKLAVIYNQDDARSLSYLRGIKKASRDVKMKLECIPFQHNIEEKDLLALIKKANIENQIHAIQIHFPLPGHICKEHVIESIAPHKDVDCIHPLNLGKFMQRQSWLQPCTASAVMLLLHSVSEKLAGKNALVVGSSNAGLPIAIALLNADCTVSVCNVHTKNLSKHVQQADIVVSAVGKRHLISGEWIKPGAFVIDVGISALENGSVQGDVDYPAAKQKTQWITPVPGGVGPVTIAVLLQNTLKITTRRGT